MRRITQATCMLGTPSYARWEVGVNCDSIEVEGQVLVVKSRGISGSIHCYSGCWEAHGVEQSPQTPQVAKAKR